ncbi:hypothetical protein ACFL4W_01480 [Planctomycetota bacterium]
MSGGLNVPILFLIFNRSDTAEKVFERIREIKPAKLYAAADGPRPDKEGEAAKCEETRAIIEKVDWPCDVQTLFREENLGCKDAVSGAIDWFFENEPEGIILEDDCHPDLSFFGFCRELLERYRDDMRIGTISGTNFLRGNHATTYSYHFSGLPGCWGWATWRRAWKTADMKMACWPEAEENEWLKNVLRRPEAVEHWTRCFRAVHAEKINTWAYRWVFTSMIQNYLTVIPSRNLVTNIGLGHEDAAHTSRSSETYFVPSEEMPFPLKHPPFVFKDCGADHYTDKYVTGVKTAFQRKLKRLKRHKRNFVKKMKKHILRRK